MTRRTAVISVIILLAGLAVLGYFLQQGRRDLLTDPYKAVPSSAVVIIETADLQNFMNSVTTGKGLPGELGKIGKLEKFNGRIRYLADQLNKPWYKKIAGSNTALVSFHLRGKKLKALLSMALPAEIRNRQIREMLHQAGAERINEAKDHGKVIFGIPVISEGSRDTISITLVSGLLLCSTDRKLLDEAVLQAGRDNDIRSLAGFSQVSQASGRNEDKIFIVFKNISGLAGQLLKKGSPWAGPEKFADCAGGDIYLSDNGLVLSGYTESLDKSEFLFRFKSGIPGTFHAYRVLPSSTILFEELRRSAVSIKPVPVMNDAGALAEKMSEYTGEDITRAVLDIKGNSARQNTLFIYELKNRVFAEKIFLDAFVSGGNAAENTKLFQPDDQVSIPVYKTRFNGFARSMIPGYNGDVSDSLFAFYDNYLITGNTFETISRLLYDNILNKTLANDLSYRDFESTLPSIAGYYFYCVPSGLLEYFSGSLDDEAAGTLKANSLSLSKIPALGYRVVASNNMIYNSLSVRYKEEAKIESTTEWETLLDTVAAIKPFFFTNHMTGMKEIFIQDLNNNAYLVNSAGRILWKVPLKERIKGTVYMIDYFRNGKYQLLFSGENYLHMLDRNGNYVERYPVKLRSRATNSLALFDYDNDRNYRLLIAGEDKMIYAYDKTGSVVRGWRPFKTSGTVSSEITWCRVSGKDYIIAADEASVYLLDRSGSIRVGLKEPVTKAPNSAIRLVAGTTPVLVCTAPDGTVQQIYFDGSVNKFKLRDFSFDHSFDIFDADGDGFGEYIFLDRGVLYLYNHNRTEVFAKRFTTDKLGGPISFTFSSSGRKIGVIDAERNLIYLIGSGGETMKGFPLRGASMFSIGKLSDKSGWHLIVGGTDRFLYNYKLDTDLN